MTDDPTTTEPRDTSAPDNEVELSADNSPAAEGKAAPPPTAGSGIDHGSEDDVLDKLLADDDDFESPSITALESKDAPPPSEGDDGMFRALRRDGVPQAVIDRMKETPELLSEWATKAMKRQADVDAYTEKMRALEEKSSESDSGEQTPTPEASEPADAEESTTSNNSLDALADELGEDAVEPLRQLQDQVTNLAEQLADAKRSAAEAEVMHAVERVTPTVMAPWGELSEDQKSQVFAKMGELGEALPGTFNSIDDLMRKAAVEVLGEPPTPKRRTATPSPPTRTAKLERPATPDNREDAALDVILSGGTVDQAKQATMR